MLIQCAPDDKLYIVMDLIDGVTLGEHVASLKEKKEKFSESQIWKIFMQVILYQSCAHKVLDGDHC